LLYHTHEYDDAETYLQKSLALDPNSVMANTSLGLVKMRDRKFDEAKKYLEKAMAGDRKNHFVYYNYAYILSRESMDEFGYVNKFSAETAKKIREALQKAIEIKPDFTESYRLLGFINLVNNESLDESLVFLKKGLALQPGNQDYALLVAQIYLRQEKYAEAKEIAEKIVKTAAEGGQRATAQTLLNSIRQFEEAKSQYDKQLKDMENKGIKPPVLKKKSELSEAELAKINEENEINNLNGMIAEPLAGEKRVVGRIEKIVCARGEINYTVKTDTETVLLSSKDFLSIQMIAMVKEAENVQVGCDAKMSDILTVITYLSSADAKAKSKGKVISLIFVPKFFKLKSDEELAKEPKVYVVEEEPQTEANPNEEADREKQRREDRLNAIRQALRQPQEGEKREIGIIEKIECSGQSMFFYIKTETQTLKLEAKPKDVKFAAFTPDVAQMQIGCNVKMPNVPAVITYKTSDFRLTDTAKGDLIAIEFVPKSFKL
jgi:tetratricopeptide (TPR) repeat protein